MTLGNDSDGHASNGRSSSGKNGHGNGLNGSSSDGVYDLICVGFGPASLAIAIALHDSGMQPQPKVLYLERQPTFSWHSGMLLPGTRMQISFIKDLATLRDPRSKFTFLNYLHEQGRLLQFVNLGTFLPLREEYNDYMSWCAKNFEGLVSYGEEVRSIEPASVNGAGEVESFSVVSAVGGIEEVRRAKHVIIAVGGRPNIPAPFKAAAAEGPEHYLGITGTRSMRIIHSSKYRVASPKVLSDRSANYRIAVVGGGQSAAEIFADLIEKYPNASTSLIIKDTALRPSDDSPFVNEIFEPDKVDKIYSMPSEKRRERISSDRATNYGVVRLELLEKLYHDLYLQRLRNPEESTWKKRIVPCSHVQSASIHRADEGVEKVRLSIRRVANASGTATPEQQQQQVQDEISTSDYDVVFVATGYVRDVHETLLRNCKHMMEADEAAGKSSSVERNYSVKFTPGSVSKDAGLWLQGCNESTHGLSDTLLSIVSVRAGEVVDSIFGAQASVEKFPAKRSAVMTAAADSNGHSVSQ